MQVEVELLRDSRLRAGRVSLPGAGAGERVTLRLGSVEVKAIVDRSGARKVVRLAPDLWERLAVPFDGIRLLMRRTESGEVEFGPSIAVLYAGPGPLHSAEARSRIGHYYGDRIGAPGLFALAFDEAIDWDRGVMTGHVLDNRPGQEGRVRDVSFPIPSAVRLAWSIRRPVIERLRELTGNRTFNWARSIGKWQFHSILSEDAAIAPHLPETRLLRGTVDLAAMLLRHGTIFVKHVHGIKGTGSVRIQQNADGFLVSYLANHRLVRRELPDLAAVAACVREVVGPGRCVVQRAIPITGLEGRALHYRIVTVRTPEGGWRLIIGSASVAGDPEMIFTNLANGAEDQEIRNSLLRHYGMGPEEAERCLQRMGDLCLSVSERLGAQFDPLGILGIDIVVEAGTHHLWLLEANSVPGLGYPEQVEREIARSQIAYGLGLLGPWDS